RRSTLALSTMALLLLGTGFPASNAVAQQKSIKEQLVGTWTFVSAVNTRPDGTTFDAFAKGTPGILIFDNTGHFSSQIIQSNIPKFVSNNRKEGTADEFKAVAMGILSYFGTYSLEDSGKTLIQHVESSSFPNFNGTNRTWAIAITGDELTISGQAAASGGRNILKWKRVK
ncbi:MAG: lipocalin-like domain-containing protein, partial [Pseudomonadales bacterium]